MRIFIACCGLLLCMLSAQAQEVSVPLDTTGKIFVITIELEKKLNLFPDFPGFMEARLYQDSDSAYFLEVLEQRDSTVVRKRVPQTDEQVAELRKQVSTAISMRSPQTMYDQSGRVGLLVNSAILAGGYYGWAYPTVARMEDSKAPAVYFLITGAGIMIPYFMTANANISRATAMMDFYGGSRGIAHGVAFYYMLDPKEDSERAPATVGQRYYRQSWRTPGAEPMGRTYANDDWQSRGDRRRRRLRTWRLAHAIVAGHDLWNEEHQAKSGMMVLGGSLARMICRNAIGRSWTTTRAEMPMSCAVLVCSAREFLRQLRTWVNKMDNDDKTAYMLATGGSVVALGVGHRLLRNKDFSSSQGLTVLIAEFGVATATTAVMVIISDEDHSGPYSAAAAVGGTAWISLSALQNASKSARTIRHSMDIDFQFNPLPLMTEIRQTDNPAADHRAKQGSFAYLQVLRL